MCIRDSAGSGVDKIMTAWAEQNWKKPEFDFSERSDRVTSVSYTHLDVYKRQTLYTR